MAIVTTEVAQIDPRNPDENIIGYAAELIKKGKLVAFPTETVYGLGANALDQDAVAKIFAAKGRPADNPLIVHIAKKEDLTTYAKDIPDNAWKLADAFWPGPLTFVLKKQLNIPDNATAGLDTVCLRMPRSSIALELIKKAGVPIAAPSANSSTRPSPTTAQHVLEDLEGKVDLILDGGSVEIGLESTVLDLTQDIPTILRPGGVTVEALQNLLPHVQLVAEASGVTRAPGMKYKHYSPSLNVVVFEGSDQFAHIKQYVHNHQEERLKILSLQKIEHLPTVQQVVFENVTEMTHAIFDEFRKAEHEGITTLLVGGVEKKGLGVALMNRLEKAATKILS